MCGFCGLFTPDNSASQPEFKAAIRQMMQLMVQRGPDSKGYWSHSQGHLQLGFRRLAVLDLSPAGNQPMVSATHRSVLVLNGEIYNFKEIRSKLESMGQVFRSRSDTEVLLYALEAWGTDAINRLNGMFAFAWYDIPNRMLLLARDHAGIKPLYYFIERQKKGLAFASQYNQLLHTPWGEPGPLRLDVLHLYLRLHHILPPYGLHQNIYQLEPGHYLKVNADGQIANHTWWRMPRSPQADLHGSSAVGPVRGALENAVARQRIADVPLGVFLSGGVDSPLVSAITRKQTGPGLKAFTVGNPGWRQDESADAEQYAKHLNVDFHLRNVTGSEMLAVVSKVWDCQNEPFADFSIIPTLIASRFARQEVTVALSGDGGDELFFGYERPLSLLRNGKDFRFPWLVRYALYATGRLGVTPNRSGAIAARSPGEYYFGVNCRLSKQDLKKFAPGIGDLPEDFILYAFEKYRSNEDLANYSRYVEFYGQLQRGLKKVDMASMYNSLEVRLPMLDREVIETSLRIDPFTHMRNSRRKAVLVELLGKYVPPEIIPPLKRGFSVPMADWLRGPLQPLVEDLLFSGDLYPGGVFDQNKLRNYWEEHIQRQKDHKWGIWSLMALQGWARRYL